MCGPISGIFKPFASSVRVAIDQLFEKTEAPLAARQLLLCILAEHSVMFGVSPPHCLSGLAPLIHSFPPGGDRFFCGGGGKPPTCFPERSPRPGVAGGDVFSRIFEPTFCGIAKNYQNDEG